MGRFQNLRPDLGVMERITRRDVNAPRRVDVAINEKRHMPDAVLGELQRDRWRRVLRVRMICGQRAVRTPALSRYRSFSVGRLF